jgi:hypothetical protein
MAHMTISIGQPAGPDPWPTRGHHLRIMTFRDGPGVEHVETRDIPIDVGTTEVDAKDGVQVMRLFHSEDTWQEVQTTLSPSMPHAAVSFTLPAPRYAFARPDGVRLVEGGATQDPSRAWDAMENGGIDADEGMPADAVPTSPGIRMATTSVDGHATLFMLPWTVGNAPFDARHYPGADDGLRTPRTRLRCEHGKLGMGLVHMAMSQVSDELPHILALVADGALERMCADGDALGALVIAHAMASNRHQADPTDALTMVTRAFPTVPDAHLLLAYQSLWRKDGEAVAKDLTMRAIDMGPPFLTASVAVLRDLAIHLESEPRIAARRRLSALVDPGCLFTSVVMKTPSRR